MTVQAFDVRVHGPGAWAGARDRLEEYLAQSAPGQLSRQLAWLTVLQRGMRHVPYCLEATEGGQTRGVLPLAYVHSLLFGRFLVSLPYLNYGGVVADDAEAARALIDAAVRLADTLDVRYLELRHEQAVSHPSLGHTRTDKVHMRLPLPATGDALWKALPSKVRNQVRKGQGSNLAHAWGGVDLLDEFYAVFSHNMRDLGTPVYGEGLFRAVLRQFPDRAELCVLRSGRKPVAGALLLHGRGVTEVPSASSLRAYNPTCANMLMYWLLLERAVGRGQAEFDFGRSSRDGSTYRFKKQWGAAPFPAEWQYYTRRGTVGEMRTDNPRYGRFIRIWQRLPVALTRWLGPPIVRGIP